MSNEAWTTVRGRTAPGLPAPVVASAWNVQMRATGASDPWLPLFVSTYEHGPQAPEHGGVCQGGIGIPKER